MKISVCIATYNGSQYIEDQIYSILTQIGESDEIIISDDNSTDDTIELIKKINDNRIQIFQNKVNDNNRLKPIYKATKNFENALKRAKGEIIFLSDQDDIWEPIKVESCVNQLENSQVLLLVHDAYIFNDEDYLHNNSYFAIANSGSGILKNLYKNTYLGCCMVFKKELLDISLPFPKKLHAHDMWLGINAEIYGESIFINRALVKYRRHSSNVTMSSEKSRNSLFYRINFRVQFIFQLVFILIKRKLEVK